MSSHRDPALLPPREVTSRLYRYRIAQEGKLFYPEWAMTKFEDWRRYPHDNGGVLCFKSLELARVWLGFRKALDDYEEPEAINPPLYHDYP